MPRFDAAAIQAIERKLTDEGKLIEAGWRGLRLMAVAPDAPQLQLDEMRMAFFAGAKHLFDSIMSIMEEGAEPTDADLDRMGLIAAELDAFGQEFELRHVTTEGTG